MRISHKLILGFTVVALLVGVAGYISVYVSQKALQQSIGKNSVALAAQVMSSIDRNIHSKIERLQSFADPSLQKALIKSNQEFEQLDNIQNYINEKEREWTSVPKEEITPFMKELNNHELSKALRKRARFYEEKYGFSIFPEVFVTNKYGANTAQTGKTSDYRQDDEEWWQRAEKDGLYVGDVEYDESAASHSVAIGMRIDDEDGNFVGIMKALLNIEEVINIIKTIEATHKHETVEFKLITKDRKIIYSTEESELFEQIPDEFLSPFGCSRGKHVEYFMTEGDKPGESEELFAHAHSKGYRDFKGLGWILIVEHKTEEIFAPIANLKNILLIISLIVTTFAILIGLFISRSIAMPVIELKAATAEIGKGNLDTQIEIKSNDEVGQLAASFKKMVGDLKKTTTSIGSLNREIAERRQAEKTLERAYTKLENANRELKEMQSQMVQSEKLASIGQLAAGVAHEMNTPVGFVASNFQTLESYVEKFKTLLQMYSEFVGKVDNADNTKLLTKASLIDQSRNDMQMDFILEDIQGLFDDSREGLERITEIIQSLRDFSRIDQPGSRDEYNVNSAIETTLIVATNEINYDAEVKTEFSEVPLIFCNSGQINQVLLNILVNAAQAIKSQERDGKGTITIRTYASDDKVVCEISDDGPGIPTDELLNIFDPFFTTKPAGRGTGLGLSVSYDIIVNKHNGKLLVDSTVGEGTKFTIKLPISTKENGEKEKEIISDGKENSIIC